MQFTFSIYSESNTNSTDAYITDFYWRQQLQVLNNP